jgi:hypothetical protein
MVISLDLTEECYQSSAFTLENLFVEKANEHSLLRFGKKKDLKKFLIEILPDTPVIKNAEADESWQYDEHDVHCFSLCLPCRCLRKGDMHNDAGVAIQKTAPAAFAEALHTLLHGLDTRLAARESTATTTQT